MNFFNMALDFIFPPICGICGEINKNYICTKCYKDIRKLEKCITNKYNNKYYSEHLYIFKYEGTIRKRIIEYKFEDKAYLYKTFSENIRCAKLETITFRDLIEKAKGLY